MLLGLCKEKSLLCIFPDNEGIRLFSKCHTDILKRSSIHLLHLQHVIPCAHDISSSQSTSGICQTSLRRTKLKNKKAVEAILREQYSLWKLFPRTDGAGTTQAFLDKKSFSFDHPEMILWKRRTCINTVLGKAPITFCLHKVKMPKFFHYCLNFSE